MESPLTLKAPQEEKNKETFLSSLAQILYMLMEIFSNLKCCLDVTSAIPFRQDILESYMYENCDLVVSVNILMVVCMPLFLGPHDTQLCALIRD